MQTSFVARNRVSLVALLALLLLPFIIGLFDGASPLAVWSNQSGNSKFAQGLAIEIFILALYALSYDLIFGITGLLSFGHSMFFAVGAYLTGIAIKSFGLSLLPTLGLVFLAAILQAILFGLVLPRVKGITFALVTLGIASVFHIVVMSSELGAYTGADVGLQGVIVPAFISPANERLRFYFLALAILVVVYLLYQRFVNSPTGRVCIAIRENESRAQMLGYNTFYFKLAALTLSSLTAALAGFLHTLYQPIVSPNVAGLGFTVTALLIILIGGVGTLNGALVGAIVFRLLDFGLRRYIGESASFINGAIYVAFVLFIPFGIVGTWRLRSLQIKQGWERLFR
ncbi:MAG: branched-chain amino acid ABC transporter permease [Anaerolineales bacterium]|nr:branched-chain amino acid ABC transporter permease [Anaerolineales bacterium]NUQ85283.1 branched-chain amino acid ABC transporter permease [Anaerolineales bacterium]